MTLGDECAILMEGSGPIPGRDPRRARRQHLRVWTAIALHTTPGIPEFMEPEVALVTARLEYDVPASATTFGSVKADVLERFVPDCKRAKSVGIIENSIGQVVA